MKIYFTRIEVSFEGFLLKPGFVLAVEVLLFRQKDPKPFLPQCAPSGPLRGSPTPAAAQLAPLKQCSPKTPESAALLGHTGRLVT
jgi:hypothetical protein